MDENFLLDRLCRVYAQITLPDGETIRVRALSDIEIRARNMEAARAAAVFSRALRNPQSPEFEANILPVLEAGDDVVRDVLLVWRMTRITREVQEEIRPRVIPIPDNATDEERNDVLLKREQHILDISEERRKKVDALLEKVRGEIKKKSGDELREMLVKEAPQAFSDAHFLDVALTQTLYLATEKGDGNGHFFSHTGDVRSLHPKVRDALRDKYAEVDNIDPFSLASRQ